MSTKTISQQKVGDLSHMMVKHLNDKLEALKDQVRLKIEESLKRDYPSDILYFFDRFPKFVVKCSGINLSWNGNYRFTVYPKLPKYPYEEISLEKMFTASHAERFPIISDLMEEYCQVTKKRDELRNKIKCTLNTLKSYARIKNEFPEAYKLLVEKIDKEVLNVDDPCTDVEALRAELTAK